MRRPKPAQGSRRFRPINRFDPTPIANAPGSFSSSKKALRLTGDANSAVPKRSNSDRGKCSHTSAAKWHAPGHVPRTFRNEGYSRFQLDAKRSKHCLCVALLRKAIHDVASRGDGVDSRQRRLLRTDAHTVDRRNALRFSGSQSTGNWGRRRSGFRQQNARAKKKRPTPVRGEP